MNTSNPSSAEPSTNDRNQSPTIFKSCVRAFTWLVPPLLAIVVFLPMLDAGFVWDDTIVFNGWLDHFDSVRDLVDPSPEQYEQSLKYGGRHFFPMLKLSLKFDEALTNRMVDAEVPKLDQARARIPHATNIAIHALNTLFVTILVFQILGHRPFRHWGAFVAGTIFALHPIHAESVCFILGRTDPLATLFLLPSFSLALRYLDRGHWLALVVAPLLFLLALLSKEVAIVGLVLLPLVAWFVRARRVVPLAITTGGVEQQPAVPARGSGGVLSIAYVLVTICYGVVRASLADSIGLRETLEPFDGSYKDSFKPSRSISARLWCRGRSLPSSLFSPDLCSRLWFSVFGFFPSS